MPDKIQTAAPIINNGRIQNDYFQLDLEVPPIARLARPGQFVHVQFPEFQHRILRRPFSIFDTDPASGRLSIIYKIVGEGTGHLSRLQPGTSLDLLGPLGNGFTAFPAGEPGVIVAGGYGCAATFMLAKSAPTPPVVLIGGRSRDDILLRQNFLQLGCDLRTATNDGSEGHHGMVTELLPALLTGPARPPVAACGPNPMLKAISDIVTTSAHDAEISLDHAMCCGIGACFACVVKCKANTPDGWTYRRACVDGPVFKASQIWWD
ncbi:MAG: dihydroorotate dehydrogenase electron transfer subunit [Lentisphaeria bacterium]|nr:dihydroorotate dehydrogenase electron transfer subunit [Lentisphaeria bacterium]